MKAVILPSPMVDIGGRLIVFPSLSQLRPRPRK